MGEALARPREEHGVIGQLAGCLRKLHEDSVPPGIRRLSQIASAHRFFLSLRLTAELFGLLGCSVRRALGPCGKGPVLAVQAYGDPAMRSYGDLDMLVRQGDIRRATELMSAAGYAPTVSLTTIDAGKIPGHISSPSGFEKSSSNCTTTTTLRYFPHRLPLEEFSRGKSACASMVTTSPPSL